MFPIYFKRSKMKKNNEEKTLINQSQGSRPFLLAGLFIMCVIAVQLQSIALITVSVLFGAALYALGSGENKSFVWITVLFSAGFSLYLFVSTEIVLSIEPREWELFLKRASLLFIALPLWLAMGQPFPGFMRKVDWQAPFKLPFHQTTLKRFLWIAISINMLAFLPFIVQNGWPYVKSVWLLAIVFSIVNAALEEWIWRGLLLSRFSVLLGHRPALLVTSLGFGLQHYSLGFSWFICLAFAVGGLFYGLVTVQSRSLLPAVLWHFMINMLMVFAGLLELKSG